MVMVFGTNIFLRGSLLACSPILATVARKCDKRVTDRVFGGSVIVFTPSRQRRAAFGVVFVVSLHHVSTFSLRPQMVIEGGIFAPPTARLQISQLTGPRNLAR